MALDGLASAVVYKQHRQILGIIQCLHFRYGGIYLGLCHVVVGIAVVAHKPVLHHTEESMCTEEFRKVVARGQAALLVEMQQAAHTALLILYGHGVLAQHLEEPGIELGVIAQDVIVEEELVVHVGLRPDVVGKEVRTLGIEGAEDVRQRTFRTIVARGALAIVPQHHVGEQVVGNLRQTAHVQRSLVLVSYLVTGSPMCTGTGGEVLNDTAHGVIVIAAMVPTAVHVAGTSHTIGQTVHVVVVAIVAGIDIAGTAHEVNHEGGSGIWRLFGIGIYGSLVHHTHQQAFPQHDIVPFVYHILDLHLFVQVFGQSLVTLGVGIVQGELQGYVLAQYGHVGLCGTLLDIFPVGIPVGGIQVVAHLVVVSVDMAALDVNLQVGIVGELAHTCILAALVAVEGLHHVIDAVVRVGRIAGNNIQAALQFNAMFVAAQFAMAGIGREIQRCTILNLTLHHHIEQ